ncbi:MAG: hypothetical protein GTO45_05080 [Candidatus Aminicenantes bacterium]|nr:hypothetical protein [Candidatus Aminicenantes bacterium]NIM78126.1 hypothetical protein [Candidatus Aminicenantes bacterium]NIN17444.1 hypothetical protein [Candidatus Aminicenantes bacterium]NIN41340.1 hypothetical protein [Candidatus Aminicenantes bacterium]NIN84110.1 hypothetical protein [Candidatus Aminicenantes bacterium]
MSVNKISAEVAQETEDRIIQAFTDAEAELPFLTDLTSEERIRMVKLSRKYVDFVDKSHILVETHPQYLPTYLNLDEFTKDVNLKNSLNRIYARASSFIQKLKDTILLVESEAYQTSRLFYKSAQAAAKEGAEDAGIIVKTLSYHFKDHGPKTGTDNTDSTDSTDITELNPKE